MANRNLLIILIASALLVVALAGAGALLNPINQQRRQLELTVHPEVTENLPPDVALAYVASGSFRGLMVDFLWGRATQLKEEGKFHEAMELSRWITKLQPRFPEVWSFHSWNMAYNISVATHTQRERWMWVQAGIELLRDEAIPLNPRALQLYKDLSHTFAHKVGQFSDDMHWYYKRQLAREWHELLGAPPVGSTEAMLAWFAPVAEMDRRYFADERMPEPMRDRIERLVGRHDEVADELRGMRFMNLPMFIARSGRLIERWEGRRPELVRDLREMRREAERVERQREVRDPVIEFRADHPRAADQLAMLERWGFELGESLLRRIGTTWIRLESAWIGPESPGQADDAELDGKLADWLANQTPEVAEARDRLVLPFLRAKVLREHYHMSPAFMYELMEGEWLAIEDDPTTPDRDESAPLPLPIDWRHPSAHALYWAARGVRMAATVSGKTDTHYYNLLNTDRNTLHALQSMVHRGQVVFDPAAGYFRLLPDPRFIFAYERALIGAGQRIGGAYVDSAAPESFQVGHENFLIWSLQFAYFYGYEGQAQEIYDRLARLYGHKEDRAERYRQSLDRYVLGRVYEEATSLDAARQMITGFIRQALVEGYANNRSTPASRFLDSARDLHRYYMQRQDQLTYGAERNRMALPPFEKLVEDTFAAVMVAPLGQVNLTIKQRLWRYVPQDLKQTVWPRVRQPLTQQLQRTGLDEQQVLALFPPPDTAADARPAGS